MNGELIQMVQIALTANHYLQMGEMIDCVDYQHIESIHFCGSNMLLRLVSRKIEMDGIVPWITLLKQKRFQKVWMSINTKGNATFGGMANANIGRGLIVENKKKTIAWVGNWKYLAARKKWSIEYTEQEIERLMLVPEAFPNNTNQLYSALVDIEKFARAIDCDGWAQWFHNAWKTLDGEEVNPHYDCDFFGLLSPEKLQLFHALTWAWVFGSMGWWNDSPPYMAKEKGMSDDFEYLTTQLYENVLIALVHCVNT